jgi:tripartite-type tricarboxylate transporter receptor subunit TctC
MPGEGNMSQRFVIRLFAALLLGMAASPAAAADYPTRPIRVVCPFPAGGTADVVARLVALKLGEAWGQSVVVENRVGASGNIGADFVAKADPDGYTLLVTPPPPLSVNPSLYKTMPYDAATAFAWISVVAQSPSVLVINPKVPFKTIQELVAFAKANPGKLNYASQGGGGTTSHLTAAMMSMDAGIELTHVPYKGSAPALTDLLGGQVDMMFDNLGSSLQHIRAGTLRVLAIASDHRSKELPDTPTMNESGFTNFIAEAWFSAAAPARTSPEIVRAINSVIVKSFKQPDVAQKLAAQGLEPVANSPEEMGKFVQEETVRWRKVIQAAGVQLE